MARPVYPHELTDADFSWLLNSYKEKNPMCSMVEVSTLPVVLLGDTQVPEERIVPPEFKRDTVPLAGKNQ